MIILLLHLGSCQLANGALENANDPGFFETRVRPVLIEHCFECHGRNHIRGDLRVDSREALIRGGQSGPALIPGKGSESLLIRLIKRSGVKGSMPPKAPLPSQMLADLEAWVGAGAPWPAYDRKTIKREGRTNWGRPMAPDSKALAPGLQVWLKADGNSWRDGQPIHVWEDMSARGHDLVATSGARREGTGLPATFVAQSDIGGLPAVRFGPATGLGGNGSTAPAIVGDAEFTLLVVARVRGIPDPREGLIAGFGEPTGPANPGKARSGVFGIRPQGKGKPVLVGGFGNDATPAGNRVPVLMGGPPTIVTLARKKGGLAASSQFWVNGISLGGMEGSTSVPDLAIRPDLGFFMGRAKPWLGGFDGDVSEVILFNRALASTERQALETHLSAKYRIPIDDPLTVETGIEGDRGDPAFHGEGHWAFAPVRKPSVPSAPPGLENPIDRFIEAGWKKNGLRPVPRAETRALVRRLYFDLTGLPPTPVEMEGAMADLYPWSDRQWAALVDRLLESPRYGERWGRHWLDVARYADTGGDNADYPIPEARLYRDYVIDSFQRDIPFDQFVGEQVAGDILARENPSDRFADKVAATGFLALSRRYATGPYEFWHLTLEDTIDTVGQAFMGLNLKCARCHDHKFDPVTQRDYYALYGIFESTQFPWAGAEEFSSQKKPREHFVPLVPQAGSAAVADMKPGGDKKAQEAARRRGFPVDVPLAYAVKEGNPRPALFQHSGDPGNPGPAVARGGIGFLGGNAIPIPPGQSGRLQLAKWIASRDHPLTSRVLVNRLWRHHFGRGLVGTPNDFGVRGAPPSNRPLLDWLAATFMENGWSVKAMHRLILSSQAWRLSSGHDPGNFARDPENAHVWRHGRRRLDAESIRDSMMAIAGLLKFERPGEHPFPPITDWAYSQHVQFKDFYPSPHRSVYLMTPRLQRHPFLSLFDGPDTNATTGDRTSSIVPAQALYLMNSSQVAEMAGGFAKRVMGFPADQRVAQAFMLAYQRPPTDSEEIRFKEFLRDGMPKSGTQEAWIALCKTLLVSNEFFHLD